MTIRLRLTIYWAAVLAAIVLLAGIAVMVLYTRQQWGELDGALIEEVDTAAAAIARLGQGPAVLAIARRLSEERDFGPRKRVRILGGGRVIADFGDASADLPPDEGAAPVSGIRDGRQRIFRFAVGSFTLDGRPAVLVDGVDATVVRKSVARLRESLLLVLPLLLAASIAGGYLLAGRALAPISMLARALAAIEPRQLDRRLKPGPADDEVARLTREINALLERVERAANTERRFAADAAHELRTPLSVIRSGLEIALGRERSRDDYVRALEAALGAVVALCATADDLLTLARLDHEAAVEREPLNLRALVHEVVEAVDSLAQSKDLALAANLDGDLFVNGNRSHLRRLLVNLLDNALTFTPAHGRVEVALAARGGRATLTVADSGPGIPAGDLPHVFDRFFRGKTRGEGGTGLGLSLCREIARRHGGDIAATNRADGGSQFVVTLPLLAHE